MTEKIENRGQYRVMANITKDGSQNKKAIVGFLVLDTKTSQAKPLTVLQLKRLLTTAKCINFRINDKCELECTECSIDRLPYMSTNLNFVDSEDKSCVIIVGEILDSEGDIMGYRIMNYKNQITDLAEKKIVRYVTNGKMNLVNGKVVSSSNGEYISAIKGSFPRIQKIDTVRVPRKLVGQRASEPPVTNTAQAEKVSEDVNKANKENHDKYIKRHVDKFLNNIARNGVIILPKRFSEDYKKSIERVLVEFIKPKFPMLFEKGFKDEPIESLLTLGLLMYVEKENITLNTRIKCIDVRNKNKLVPESKELAYYIGDLGYVSTPVYLLERLLLIESQDNTKIKNHNIPSLPIKCLALKLTKKNKTCKKKSKYAQPPSPTFNPTDISYASVERFGFTLNENSVGNEVMTHWGIRKLKLFDGLDKLKADPSYSRTTGHYSALNTGMFYSDEEKESRGLYLTYGTLEFLRKLSNTYRSRLNPAVVTEVNDTLIMCLILEQLINLRESYGSDLGNDVLNKVLTQMYNCLNTYVAEDRIQQTLLTDTDDNKTVVFLIKTWFGKSPILKSKEVKTYLLSGGKFGKDVELPVNQSWSAEHLSAMPSELIETLKEMKVITDLTEYIFIDGFHDHFNM